MKTLTWFPPFHYLYDFCCTQLKCILFFLAMIHSCCDVPFCVLQDDTNKMLTRESIIKFIIGHIVRRNNTVIYNLNLTLDTCTCKSMSLKSVHYTLYSEGGMLTVVCSTFERKLFLT